MFDDEDGDVVLRVVVSDEGPEEAFDQFICTHAIVDSREVAGDLSNADVEVSVPAHQSVGELTS